MRQALSGRKRNVGNNERGTTLLEIDAYSTACYHISMSHEKRVLENGKERKGRKCDCSKQTGET